MNKQCKYYEATFKLEVARMVVDQGLSIAQVVKDMSIGRSAVCRWIDQYRAELQGKPGIGKSLTAELQRIRQLENENRQLKSDNAILKKHRTSFTQNLQHLPCITNQPFRLLRCPALRCLFLLDHYTFNPRSPLRLTPPKVARL